MSELENAGYIEVDSDLLLDLIQYALEDPIVAATDLAVHTPFCRIKLIEPNIVFLQFNLRFGLWAEVSAKAYEKIKKSYLEVDHEIKRIKTLN